MNPPGVESNRPLIWMSRTLPFARESADRLAWLGYEAVVAPLLHVLFLPAALRLQGVSSVIFTSRHGVAAFCDCTPERRFSVFAVGDATADAARRAGFHQVASAGGDVGDLRDLVLAKARRDDGAVLRAGAQEPAGALAADLAEQGFDVVDWPAYRTVDADGRDVIAQIRACGRTIEAALVYSPKAAQSLSRLLADQQLPLRNLICISEATAAELRAHDAYPISVAERPNEASLLAALQAGLGPLARPPCEQPRGHQHGDSD